MQCESGIRRTMKLHYCRRVACSEHRYNLCDFCAMFSSGQEDKFRLQQQNAAIICELQ